MISCAATLGCNSIKEYSDYIVPTVLITAAPAFDPPAGNYTTDQNVVLTSPTVA